MFRIRRNIVIDNISKAYPELDKKQVLKIGRRSMMTLGIGIVDVFCLPFANEKWLKKNVVVEGEKNIQEALKKGKGFFALGAHMGSGDMGLTALNYLFNNSQSVNEKRLKVNLITKRFKNQWLNDYWFKVRQKHGTNLIEDRKSSFDILRALKRNEMVIFVLDQFMGPPLGVKTQFFGRETGTAMGLALLVEKTQVPVLPCYSYLRGDGKIVSVFEKEIPLQDFGSRNKTIEEMTQIYTQKIEEIVRKYPEQWMWVHRRWKEFKV